MSKKPPKHTAPQSAAPLIASEPVQTATPGDVSAPAPAALQYLAGRPLNLTFYGKIALGRLFGDDNDGWSGPQRPIEDLTLLYIAAHDRSVWLAVGQDSVTGKIAPLLERPLDFQKAVADFADETFPDASVDEMSNLAIAVWKGEHKTQVIPVQKKSQEEEFPTLTTS